jgi:hypothetical protein
MKCREIIIIKKNNKTNIKGKRIETPNIVGTSKNFCEGEALVQE